MFGGKANFNGWEGLGLSPPKPSGKSGPKDHSGGTTLLVSFAFALVHDSRGIEIVNFTISLALSAGTLMASAGRPTPYRLVPAAHFYPWAYWATSERRRTYVRSPRPADTFIQRKQSYDL